MKGREATLIIAASETDSNLYYACRFVVPDPIIFFEISGTKYLVLSDLEFDRAKLQSSADRILSLSELAREVKRKKERPLYADIVDHVFKQKKVRRIVVPSNFPALHYATLHKMGYAITVKTEPFFESRLVKTEEEKKHIIHTLRMMEMTLGEIVGLLRKSKIRGSKILHGREVITSELLKTEINRRLMERGCVSTSTIVASGAQGSFPHHEGKGPIKPHTPIIFDIFPRNHESRYWGDMTRTMVKGRPSDEVKKMFHAVRDANRSAIDMIRPGIHSSKVHQKALDILTSKGFITGKIGGRMEGFIHSTGHGLGLDIHEPPSVSHAGSILKKGNVVTVEPGLYYQKHGGMRLEDVIYVGARGAEVLTRFPTFLEIDKN